MWICKHCKENFNFDLCDRSKKANHTRWCLFNPKSSKYREENFKYTRGWSKGLTKETDSRLKNISVGVIKSIKENGHSWTNRNHKESSKQSIAVKMRGNSNGNHRGDRQSFYNGIRMDSSWETKVAKYLDDNGIKWTYGNIIYPLDDKRSYRPDFVLESNFVIEVKGYWREENKKKFEEWSSKYPDVRYEIWDKNKLKELKIL